MSLSSAVIGGIQKRLLILLMILLQFAFFFIDEINFVNFVKSVLL